MATHKQGLLSLLNISVTAATLVLLGLASAPAAAAAKQTVAQRQAGAEGGRAGCRYGLSNAGPGACLSKAEYELTESRQSALDKDPAQYRRNALMRCDGLKGDDKQDCVKRIDGQGTTTGSVEGGGIYRELKTRVVGEVPAVVTVPPAVNPAKSP